jgi:hypothetical protein
MRGFYDFLADGMDRNARAAAAVRKRHETSPFGSREEIGRAFSEEMQLLERSAITEQDRDELKKIGVIA